MTIEQQNTALCSHQIKFFFVQITVLVPHPQDPLERLPELRVEDGVDQGVHARVDVAEPGKKMKKKK